VVALAAAAGDATTLSDDELGAALVGLHRVTARLRAVELGLTRAFDRRQAWRDDGSRSMAAWLARRCNTSPRSAKAQAALARRLDLMPVAATALAAGEVDEKHVEVLGRRADSARRAVAAAFPAAEAHLVGLAKTLPFVDFVRAVRHWEDLVDEDGAEDQAASDHAARRFHVSETFRGNHALDGQLDVIGGTEFATALRWIDDELFQVDWEAAKAIHGDATALGDLARTPAQRRADALVEMARRAMATPAGARRPAPLITVAVGLETFTGRVCELFNRTVVTPGQVARLLDAADVERVVFAAPDRITSLGEHERFFRGGLRRVVEIRDRHCQHPGCRRPSDECEVDHVVPWAQGGPTTQSNGRLLCGHHNRFRSRAPTAGRGP
jgi:hypothetical protein